MSSKKKLSFTVPGKTQELLLENDATYKDAIKLFEKLTGTSQEDTVLLIGKQQIKNLNEVVNTTSVRAVRRDNVSNN